MMQEIFAIEHTLSWKDNPDRVYEGAIAIFDTREDATEWLRKEAAHAEGCDWEPHLSESEGELFYETALSTNKFDIAFLPYYPEGSLDDA